MNMKRKIISYILMGLGTVPFLAALILGLPIFRASSLTYGDFLILWSYLFWPTYILGAVLILAGIVLRKCKNRSIHKSIIQETNDNHQ